MNCTWGMVIAIITANICLGAIIVGFMLWNFSKLHSNIKSIISKIDADLRAQTHRTDRLYKMFIHLLKEHKDQKTNP